MFEVVICRNLKPIKQRWQKFYGMVSEILVVLRLLCWFGCQLWSHPFSCTHRNWSCKYLLFDTSCAAQVCSPLPLRQSLFQAILWRLQVVLLIILVWTYDDIQHDPGFRACNWTWFGYISLYNLIMWVSVDRLLLGMWLILLLQLGAKFQQTCVWLSC
jgi:hypothetical protein